MVYIDTNFFLSFFLDRNSVQQRIAKNLFQRASCQQITLYTSTLVIFEVYWTLKSFYGLSALDNKNIIKKLLDLPVDIKNKDFISQALNNFRSYNFGLEDCFHLVFAILTSGKDIATFDKKLKKEFTLFSKNDQNS